VTPTHQQTEEAIQDTIEKQAEGLRQLQLVTPAMTPEEKLKALLDDALVGNGLKSLLKARIDVATTELSARWKEYCNGRGTLDIIIASSRRLLEAETDLSIKMADIVGNLYAMVVRPFPVRSKNGRN